MNRSFFILICILLTGWNFYSRAQQSYIWKYNIEDGLVNNDILSIYQDSRGFMWLCTRGGLSRYDGSRFTNFTPENGLATDMINDIYEVEPQKFIVAQNSGGPAWLINDRIRAITDNKTITINRFYLLQNRLVGATDSHGMVEWIQSGFRQLNPSYKESINYMTAIDDSTWLLNHVPFNSTFSSSFLKNWSSPYSAQVTAVFTDSRHHIWLGTIHGLKLLDNNKVTEKQIGFLPLPQAFNIPIINEAYITDIKEDSEGNIWIGTVNGLVSIDKAGHSKIYTQQEGLPASQINCIKEDREKNIWIGTPLGLARISLRNAIKTFKPDLGPSHDGTIGMLPLSENNWRLFDGKNISILDLHSGKFLENMTINSPCRRIYRLNDDEYLLVYDGFARVYHSGKVNPETIPWPYKIFAPVIRKNGQTFLAAVGDTIFTILNGRVVEVFKTGVTGSISTIAIDNNDYIWVGTWSNGLIKIGSTGNSASYKVIDTISGRLPDPNIRTLFKNSKNEMWIGTRYKGVVRLVESSPGKYDIQNYGTRQSLSSDFVLAINEDHQGNMWVGTVQGIDKFIPEGNKYRVFNFGLVNKIFSRIYDVKFAADNSMQATGYPFLLNTSDMHQDTLPAPTVYITRVAAGPGDTSFITNSMLHLPTNKAQIYFEFSAPQFINEDFTKYSYRLLGYGDTSWKLSGKSRNVYFASLKPGTYSFEIRARGFNDLWGTPATYAFIVNTPYWQKGRFILMIVVMIGLIVYGLYRYRVRQLLHVQKVRNRIATDLHDEIGSTLTNINILSTLSKRNLSQPQKAGDFLKRISDEVSSSSQALDDIIWSVNTSHDNLEETVARMRRYAAELFDAANISYELYLDPAFESRKIGMEQRRDLYLLYKEAVNNISKHANARQVAIQLAIERNQLMLIVKDDGIGFDIHKGTEQHGLEGMKERIKKWKGKINLESMPGKGTMVQVWLPLAK